MKQIIADLKAEQESLDEFISTLNDSQWDLPTPAEGWTIRDSITHIGYGDKISDAILSGDYSSIDEAIKIGPAIVDIWARQGREMKISQIVDLWRTAREKMYDRLMKMDPKNKIPWFVLPMGARSFATARLMETWAHGLDCYETVGVEPVYTDRLRHVAMIAFLARPFAYSVNGLEVPKTPIRIELVLPSSKVWSQGPDDATDIIRGKASEFCRVAVRRGHWKDTKLEIIGSEAKRFIEIVQTYAGPPGSGRKSRNR